MFSFLSKFQRQIDGWKKTREWWLFHATDFQSLMYPCFTFCRILGIFPYNINISAFEISKVCYFLSAIVMCVYCFCVLMVIIHFYEWYGDLDEWNNIEIICANILTCLIMVVTFVLNGPRMRLLQTIMKISSKLPSEIYRKQSTLIHSKDIFGFAFIFVYSLICFHRMSIPILLEVYLIYNALLVFQVDMLHTNCVCVLKACFKRINDGLINLFTNKSHIIKDIKHEQRNPLLLMDLKALKKQHLMVSDIVQELNIIFSLQLLATMATNFIYITFEIYLHMTRWQNGLFIRWIQTNRLYTIPYISAYLIKIAWIIWACETAKNQAKKISTTVHDVLNSTNDVKIKNELRVFSLQILHRNNMFSVKGLTMDATLLTDMMNTVTTYVLILIQFLIASKSCTAKTENNVT